MLYYISKSIFWFFFKIFFKLKVEGAQNLPAKGPYIAASNHVSYLDPAIIGAAMPRNTRFLARENLFRKGLFGWWIRSTGCIPVRRSKRDIKAMKEALKYLKSGVPITVFPEGTRSINGTLKHPRAGVGFLAVKSGVPIIPAYIKGSKEALSKHSRSLRLRPISVYFGRKIESADFKKNKDHKAVYKRISLEVMNAIVRLREKHGD